MPQEIQSDHVVPAHEELTVYREATQYTVGCGYTCQRGKSQKRDTDLPWGHRAAYSCFCSEHRENSGLGLGGGRL